MTVPVYMPKLGMTMHEGTIISWLKNEGDRVKKGEPLVEISSEKITNVVEAPAGGLLKSILFPEDEIVPVGEIIAHIAVEKKDAEPIKEKENTAAKPLQQVQGKDYEVRPLSPLRRAVGKRMAESLRQAPQGTITTRADMSGLMDVKERYASQGRKVTYTDLFIKVVSIALLSNPLINSTVEDNLVYTYSSTHIGVGVGTDEALLVPVIRNVETKTLLEISRELKELTAKVKENRITPDEMQGATFTISNLGMFDVDIITPIINPPQSCILAIGTTRREVTVTEDGQMEIKPLTTLSLTADHTLVDGIPAAKFLATIKEIMSNPGEYLE